jgi:hypothetical protein
MATVVSRVTIAKGELWRALGTHGISEPDALKLLSALGALAGVLGCLGLRATRLAVLEANVRSLKARPAGATGPWVFAAKTVVA